MGLYIFPLHLQYIQVSEEFTNNPNVFNEMKIFCTLLWTAIVAIAVERCRAEFLLVEIDDAAGDAKVLPPKEQNAPASIEDPGYCIGRCGGICPPCKSEPIPKEDPDEVDEVGEVVNGKLVVKSKLNEDTLVVKSDIVGAKDSANIGEVAPEKEIRLTPQQCCEKANVPEFCLGLCSPADVMARQGRRINACSKYDTIIEECFQAAEAKKLIHVPLKK